MRIAIFNPRNTGLLPAISPFWDREMCGSAVFLYLGAEDAGINKGIRKFGPKAAARGYGAIPEGSRDARGIFGCEESPKKRVQSRLNQ